ncbi:MAG: cell wall hydrolase [Lachnospiraceae bacterium]
MKRIIAIIATISVMFSAFVMPTAQVSAKGYSQNDLRLLSSLIYSEAGGESYAGQLAVGIVVMNRKKSASFPNTLSGVIYQSGQFSPTYNGSLNRSLSLYDQGRLSQSSINAAKKALSGQKTITLNGKKIDFSNYHFFSGYVSGARITIGGHQFK